jgi:hypothetical protein
MERMVMISGTPAELIAMAQSMAESMTGTDRIIAEFMVERIRQDMQWGGPHHDDTRKEWDWCAYIEKQNFLANAKSLTDKGRDSWRRRMIKIGALALAAVESYDRKAEAAAEQTAREQKGDDNGRDQPSNGKRDSGQHSQDGGAEAPGT